MSSKVKVINAVWNGNGLLKRKVAEYYVAEGRAEWVGDDQLRLVSHPKNMAAAERARGWEADYRPTVDGDRITEALMTYGPGGLAAVDHTTTRFQPLPKRAPMFEGKRLVMRDQLIPQKRGQDVHDAVRPNGLPATWRTVRMSRQ